MAGSRDGEKSTHSRVDDLACKRESNGNTRFFDGDDAVQTDSHKASDENEKESNENSFRTVSYTANVDNSTYVSGQKAFENNLVEKSGCSLANGTVNCAWDASNANDVSKITNRNNFNSNNIFNNTLLHNNNNNNNNCYNASVEAITGPKEASVTTSVQSLDTAEVSQRIREILSAHNIGQRLFARHVLGLSQGTVSELLSKPKHWDKLTEKGRESYRRMYLWSTDENNIVTLKSFAPKKGLKYLLLFFI